MSRTIDRLNEQEFDAYTNDMAQTASDLVEKIIVLADKYDVDRDFTVKSFARNLSLTVQGSTFQQYKCKEEDDG